MSRRARSARGEVVDFDLLSIKQHLAATPVPVSAQQRRKFIDERDGTKSRENYIVAPTPAVKDDSPLDIANEAAVTSKSSKNKELK